MKWLLIENDNFSLDMNIVYDPYLLYDVDISILSPDWTAVSIIIRQSEEIIYEKNYCEMLKTDEIIKIRETLKELIDGSRGDPVSLRFIEPDLEIDTNPDSDQSFVVLNIVRADFKMNLSKKQANDLFNYLSYISGYLSSNDEIIKGMQKSGTVYDEWCWFLTGRFPGLGKVYVLPAREWWNMDGEECVTIWCKFPKYITYSKQAAYWGVVKDFKIEKVYIPKILYETNMNGYWKNSEKDYQDLCRYVEVLKDPDLSYPEVLSKLKAIDNK